MAKETKSVTPVTPVTPVTAPLPEGTAAANLAAAVKKPEPVAEPTNDAIEALKAKQIEAIKLSRTFEPLSKEESDARLEAWKIGEQIKTEVANIKKQQAENEKKMKEAERVKLLQDVIDTHVAAINGTPEQLDAAKKAFETVANILIGGAPRVATTSTGKTSNSGAGTKGATTAAIRVLIKPLYEGATRETVGEIGKAARKLVIHDEGFNDGTANAAIRAYEVELGLKD